MKEYYVNILLCADDSYYVGVTNDLQRRWEEQQFSIDPNHYTSIRKPLKMVFYELHIDINDAIAREKKIKKWTRAKKEALIKHDTQKLKELARG